MTDTIGALAARYDFAVLEHLEAEAEVPVLDGLQMQGDLAIIPQAGYQGTGATVVVPPEGMAVIEAIGGGHEHRLFASQPGTARFTALAGQDIGYLETTETAFIAHPEHAFAGIAPGSYMLRRQREQADEERLVAD